MNFPSLATASLIGVLSLSQGVARAAEDSASLREKVGVLEGQPAAFAPDASAAESGESEDAAHALEELAAAHPDWSLDVEPAYMRSSAQMLLPGAQATALVPALFKDGLLQPVNALRFILLDSLSQFVRVAQRNAEPVLKQATWTGLHDAAGTLTGFRIDSDDPRLAGSAITGALSRQVNPSLGPTHLFIIPSRHTLFVFRDGQEHVAANLKSIGEVHQQADWPISLELFRHNGKAITAVGILEGARSGAVSPPSPPPRP